MAILENKAGIRIGTDSTGAGIVLMIVTTAVFAASDTTVRIIGSTAPLLALLCVRYLFQVIALGVWQARRDLSGLFRTGSLPLQIARSLLLLSNTACTFSGLRHLPLPVTTSLAMLAPLISTLLVALVLKDEVPMNSASAASIRLSTLALDGLIPTRLSIRRLRPCATAFPPGHVASIPSFIPKFRPGSK